MVFDSIKTLLISSSTLSGFSLLLWIRTLQIIPGGEKQLSNTGIVGILLTGMGVMAGALSIIYVSYKATNKEFIKSIKSLNEDHGKQIQEIYKEHLKDQKDVISKNTEAFLNTSGTNKELADATKANTLAMQEMRLSLRRILKLDKDD